MPVYKPSELHSLGIKAKKHLSQNFLIDGNIIEKICAEAHVQEGDHVLEIGPGPGALTERILKKGARVIAIEKDPALAEQLKRLDLKVYCDDALTFPLDEIPSNTKMIANLPFHIATPIIERLIVRYPQFTSLTVVVQREVGKRMTAKVNSSMYSSFSLFLGAYSTPRYCFTVKPSSFFPAPLVHSCVVHLPLKPFPFGFSETAFFALTRRAFRQRRKMLRASLKEDYGREAIEHALEAIGFKPTARPQELTLQDFGTLFQQLQQPNQTQSGK